LFIWIPQEAGFQVTIASVKGGTVPLDPKSLTDNNLTEADKRFQNDAEAQQALNNTVPASSINVEDYVAVFIPGGHGACVDIPDGAADIVSRAAALNKVHRFLSFILTQKFRNCLLNCFFMTFFCAFSVIFQTK
jgi:putative intracellular protease/amidase